MSDTKRPYDITGLMDNRPSQTASPDDVWAKQGACLGHNPDLWFAIGTKGQRVDDIFAEARAICTTCPVIDECLEYALEHERMSSGMWGGLDQDERRLLRRRRQRQARAAS